MVDPVPPPRTPGTPPEGEDRAPAGPPAYRRPDLPFERPATLWSRAGQASAAGLEFGLAVGLFFLGGWWLDGKLGTSPWLSVVGALVGVAAGMVLLLRTFVQGPQDRGTEPPPRDRPRRGGDR